MAALVVTCGLAEARPASAEGGVRLSGAAGWAGRCHSGRPILVRARIVAERLVSGVLSAEVEGPPGPVSEVPVEVAGGQTEEVNVVVSSPFGCSSVMLRLREDGSTTTARVGVVEASDTVLVGLLPGVRPAGSMPTSALARTGVAAVAGLEPELLDQAGAVAGLDTIAATGADLDSLSADQTRGLIAWVAGGGTLLVDAERAEELRRLPEEWRPAAGGRIAAGRGQVRLTGTVLRAGKLDGLAEPAVSGGDDGSGFGFDMGGGDLQSTLRRRSGLRVVSLPVILGALVLYVLLVGPGVRIGLRRAGRLQLTWLAVPVAALTFSALAVAGGDLLRRGGKPTHLSVVEADVSSARARTFVGVPTRTDKAVRADLPAGWLPGGRILDEHFGRSSVTATSRGLRLTTPAVPGGFVVAGAEGPATVEGRLVVEPEVGTDRATVRNELRVPLDDVAVFGHGAVVAVGRIEAGATASVTLPRGNPNDLHSLAHQVWTEAEGEMASPEAFALLAAELLSGAADVGLVAAGWTDRLASPVTLAGGRPSGTTLVMGRAEGTTPTGRSVGISNNGLATTRFLVAPDDTFRLAWAAGPLGAQRFPKPFGPDDGFGGVGAEVLVQGTWQSVRANALLPAGATADGVVYLRAPFRGQIQPTLEPA